MKKAFKYFLILAAFATAFAACKKDDNKDSKPLTWTVTADESFNEEGIANLFIKASKFPGKDIALSFEAGEGTNIPAEALTLPDADVFDKDITEFELDVQIDKDQLEGGEYSLVLNVFGDDVLLGSVTITANLSEKVTSLSRVWGLYTTTDGKWFSGVKAQSGSPAMAETCDRCMAMDDDYIYVAKSSLYAAVFAIDRTDPSNVISLPNSIYGTEGSGSTFVTSCVRILKNEDSTVNNGKDIVLVSNLTSNAGQVSLVIYAYKNGIQAEPVVLCKYGYDFVANAEDWRRYGDRFAVTGTWESGKIYLPSQNANKTVILSFANGARSAITGTWCEAYTGGITQAIVYPNAEGFYLINATYAAYLAYADEKSPNGFWDKYIATSNEGAANTWGHSLFEFAGKKYLAYVKLEGETKSRLQIVETTGSEGDLFTAISEQKGLLQAPVQNSGEFNDASAGSGTMADCAVRVIDGEVFIAAMHQGVGLSLFKLERTRE